jgi:hypothetical protein
VIDDEKDVSMREATFLKFDDMYMCDDLAEYALLRMQEIFKDQIEFNI